MVQTVWSRKILSGNQLRLIEKPYTLHRIFFSVKVLVDLSTWCESWLSFDDPTFFSHYTLAGPVKVFEAQGEDIFQGDVWVRNISTADVTYSATEILV